MSAIEVHPITVRFGSQAKSARGHAAAAPAAPRRVEAPLLVPAATLREGLPFLILWAVFTGRTTS